MIRVVLINPSDRRFYMAQWDDPITGKTKSKSTRTTVKRDAERFAAKLENDLNAGTYKPLIVLTWEELQTRYLTEVSASKRKKTKLKTQSMFNGVKKHIAPKYAAAMADANAVSKYATKLRELGRTPDTIDGHLRELRKVMRWAKRMGIISEVPHIEFPSDLNGMKGRPITEEELDRIIDQVDKSTLPKECHEEWKRLLRGLWMSGLRLEEAMKLHWVEDHEICVDFSNRRPMFRIQAKDDKGKSFRLLPITPDFAEFLLKTPKAQRTGFVFKTLCEGKGWVTTLHRPTTDHVGKVISALGEAAKVKVNENKFASAHDFRRAFGTRWAKIVMPAVLKNLMRHADVATTMKYYVEIEAQEAADEVWDAVARRAGNTSGNSRHNRPQPSQEQLSETP